MLNFDYSAERYLRIYLILATTFHAMKSPVWALVFTAMAFIQISTLLIVRNRYKSISIRRQIRNGNRSNG